MNIQCYVGILLNRLGRYFLWLSIVLTPVSAWALEFKSVLVPKAILYDAPSSTATKVLILGQNYPVEMIVNLGAWQKVRDAQGGIHWIEAKQLSSKRTVIVIGNNAELRESADVASTLVATVDKDVLLELVDTKPMNGWLKVKHVQGATGYILLASIWGYN